MGLYQHLSIEEREGVMYPRAVSRSVCEMTALSGLPVHTATTDRSKEFTDWTHVSEAIGTESYLCAVHHP